MIGAIIILPLLALPDNDPVTGIRKKTDKKALLIGGIVCGIFLAAAANLQQFGILFNTDVQSGDSGKAGFITALYIVLVPVIGIFFKRKPTKAVVISVAVAVVGLYLISVKSGFTVSTGDIFLILCALGYAFQIIAIDHWSDKVNCIALSSIEFFVASVISLILMLIFENPDIEAIKGAIFPILYLGLLSVGVAYIAGRRSEILRPDRCLSLYESGIAFCNDSRLRLLRQAADAARGDRLPAYDACDSGCADTVFRPAAQ